MKLTDAKCWDLRARTSSDQCLVATSFLNRTRVYSLIEYIDTASDYRNY